MAQVKNRYLQPPNETDVDDNELILDGTVTQGAGGVMTRAGNNVDTGDNSHSGTETFTGPVESSGGANLKTKLVSVKMTDISTAKSVWVVPGFACTIVKISSVISGAIITVDAGITTEIDGTPVTNGDLTIAFTGSAAGIVDQNVPTAANVVAADEAVEIITDGLSTNAVDAVFTLELLPA